MPKAEWGKKVVCSNCETKFYDLNRKPAICPNCGTEYIDPTVDSTPSITKQVFKDDVDVICLQEHDITIPVELVNRYQDEEGINKEIITTIK